MHRRFLKSLGHGFLIALAAWMIFSFVEVNAKNRDHNPDYSHYNLFVVISHYDSTEGRL